jgi:uroporphyrinogen-III decarboxylase
MAETPENLRKLQWLYRDTEYTVEPDAVENARRRKEELEKEDVFTMSGIGPSPYMNLLQHLSGPVSTVYLMMDEPDLFKETLELMHADRMRELRAVLPANPTDTFWLTENTSTTLLSPAIFRDLCMPYLREYGETVMEHGIYPVHHMCGTLNALLEMIDELPAVANEAYTTRPLGDVSLAEGRSRMPSKALIGGTNATGWLDPVEKIVATVADDIAACPDRRKIFLTSAGVLPPLVSFEKAKAVVEEFKHL